MEFLPGRQGLLHVSELAAGENLATFKENDVIDVLLTAVCNPSPLNQTPPHPVPPQEPLSLSLPNTAACQLLADLALLGWAMQHTCL